MRAAPPCTIKTNNTNTNTPPPKPTKKRGTWRDAEFKEYNYDALGLAPPSGALHPLLKVRSQFRKIFTSMGFSEMPTNNYVESSFWNFDALFQPQQHPARDAHDTFFLTHPATSDEFPDAYLQRVKVCVF